MLQVLKFFGSDSPLDLGKHRTCLVAAAELESTLVEHVYNSPHTALGHLQAAGLALGMQTTVEGTLPSSTMFVVQTSSPQIISQDWGLVLLLCVVISHGECLVCKMES